ncbi:MULTISPECIES: AzlD domain-containing protein [Acinetobacter]|uniref:AzlD domain-containing protein n=1 Tax=Acinetobacter TaxID=469 RepID=UPI0014438F3C|nr:MULTISPECIES: AzlD domain-containing protein [Acinetobacter]MEB6564457.1 AzlD domain-containing protein [Acinetobacter towneri]
MLEFWFNPQVTVLKKIALLIIIALVTAGLYTLQPLQFDAILMFLAAGLVFLICRYCKIHFTQHHPTGWIARVLTWIPLALLLALIFMQIQHGEILISGAQGIGFTALAICLFSPLSLLHQHQASDTQ